MQYDSVIEDLRGGETVVSSFSTDEPIDPLGVKPDERQDAIKRIQAQRQRLVDRPYESDYTRGIIRGLECALEHLDETL